MRLLACALLLSSSVAARAADVVVTLNDEEQRYLAMVLEAASGSQSVKSGGLDMAKLTSFFASKIAAAAVRPQVVPAPQPQQQPVVPTPAPGAQE